MGMAASQARLLTLTARLSDVEFQAQSIQHAKIQLATQSDQVYQEYLAALDETTVAIKCINPDSAQTANIAATFNNLCSRNRVRPANGNQYALRNSSGLLIVEDDVYEAYHKGFNNAYEFAMYMMFGEYGENLFTYNQDPDGEFRDRLEAAELEVYNNLLSPEEKEGLSSIFDALMEMMPENPPLSADGSLPTIYDIGSLTDPNVPADYEEKLDQFRKLLYQNFLDRIYQELYADTTYTDNDTKEENQLEFNYYMSIYNQIQFCGGCISIDDYNGPNGDASNDSEWLTNMVKSGLISIEEIEIDKLTGETKLKQTSTSSDECISLIEKSAIDNRALAKAEAKYEHDLKQINAKDKKFDMDLSKLEAERNALDTQIKGVEKIIDENIKRSFKIFS